MRSTRAGDDTKTQHSSAYRTETLRSTGGGGGGGGGRFDRRFSFFSLIPTCLIASQNAFLLRSVQLAIEFVVRCVKQTYRPTVGLMHERRPIRFSFIQVIVLHKEQLDDGCSFLEGREDDENRGRLLDECETSSRTTSPSDHSFRY
ncbi:hypothetical protein F2P81_012129 [Scophthalmus maximus]|uniref:Uncharacterized protein n=1 Tax=Scophthalmus maximus TaxID=52904 RepID=A0A6A4STK9_SCOMX|nr:hypothetical protein F2P81_012129 [Scophthalmus maximus]